MQDVGVFSFAPRGQGGPSPRRPGPQPRPARTSGPRELPQDLPGAGVLSVTWPRQGGPSGPAGRSVTAQRQRVLAGLHAPAGLASPHLLRLFRSALMCLRHTSSVCTCPGGPATRLSDHVLETRTDVDAGEPLLCLRLGQGPRQGSGMQGGQGWGRTRPCDPRGAGAHPVTDHKPRAGLTGNQVTEQQREKTGV